MKIAGAYDSEQQRSVDRIKCLAFREVRDAGAKFINRQWIAAKIYPTTRFVSEWCEKPWPRGKKRDSGSLYSACTPLVLHCTPLVLQNFFGVDGVSLFPP